MYQPSAADGHYHSSRNPPAWSCRCPPTLPSLPPWPPLPAWIARPAPMARPHPPAAAQAQTSPRILDLLQAEDLDGLAIAYPLPEQDRNLDD